jgi:hypothetical protein
VVRISDTLFAYRYSPTISKYKDGHSDTTDLKIPENWDYEKNNLIETFQTDYEKRGFKNPIDVKFIDFDNDYKMGPIELDMGKLTQSIITKYESWDTPETEITETNNEFNQVLNMYNQILQSEHIKSKAYFYCIIHLIRMVPYQAQRDVNRCKIALSWIKKLFNELQTISD